MVTNEQLSQVARVTRAVFIQAVYKNGEITREDALELLEGELSPGHPETKFDDREFLDLTPEEMAHRMKDVAEEVKG